MLFKPGPERYYLSMRFERKHNGLKKYAASLKNVGKTIALKYQLRQCIKWNCDKTFGSFVCVDTLVSAEIVCVLALTYSTWCMYADMHL